MTTQKQSLHPTVMKFIARFTNNNKRPEVIECFTQGCCYWFAIILYERFYDPNNLIVYDDIANHWGCLINNKVYDITGDVTNSYNWESWHEIALRDSLHLKVLQRDCIYFTEE